MRKSDLYSVLEVSKSATDAEIKKSYRRLVKLYHPDKNTAVNAIGKFAEVRSAYETLGNRERRRVYDSNRFPISFHSDTSSRTSRSSGNSTQSNHRTGRHAKVDKEVNSAYVIGFIVMYIVLFLVMIFGR